MTVGVQRFKKINKSILKELMKYAIKKIEIKILNYHIK